MNKREAEILEECKRLLVEAFEKGIEKGKKQGRTGWEKMSSEDFGWRASDHLMELTDKPIRLCTTEKSLELLTDGITYAAFAYYRLKQGEGK